MVGRCASLFATLDPVTRKGGKSEMVRSRLDSLVHELVVRSGGIQESYNLTVIFEVTGEVMAK
jgi:hypothetical protein